MSSAVLSPHTTSLPLVDIGNGPQSSYKRVIVTSRSMETPSSPGAQSEGSRITTSPAPTVRSTTVTRKLRTRLSTSPDKLGRKPSPPPGSSKLGYKAAEDSKKLAGDAKAKRTTSRAANRAEASGSATTRRIRTLSQPKYKEETSDSDIDIDDDTVVVNASKPAPTNVSSQDDEEGENELSESNSEEDKGVAPIATDVNNTGTSTPRTDVPKPAHTLRLTFGKKRKAMDSESSSLSEQPQPQSTETVAENSAQAAPGDEAMAEEDAKAVLEATAELDSGRRLPRKKRKWLKKGEVDPDDPVAVARQKERHAMIDEALKMLDQQVEEINKGEHVSLVTMLSELERRHSLQLTRLEARHQAELQDLQNMRDFEKRDANFMFKEERERLTAQMNKEYRRDVAQLAKERITLIKRPGTHNMLRDGRGGGGWVVYEDHLLSNQTQALEAVEAGSSRVRRAITLDPAGIPKDFGAIDLEAMKVPYALPPSRSKSPPTSHGLAKKAPTVSVENDRSAGTDKARLFHAKTVAKEKMEDLQFDARRNRPPPAAQARPEPQPVTVKPVQVSQVKSTYAAAPPSASYARPPPERSEPPPSRPEQALNRPTTFPDEQQSKYANPLPPGLSEHDIDPQDRLPSFDIYKAMPRKHNRWGYPLSEGFWERLRMIRQDWEYLRKEEEKRFMMKSQAVKSSHQDVAPSSTPSAPSVAPTPPQQSDQAAQQDSLQFGKPVAPTTFGRPPVLTQAPPRTNMYFGSHPRTLTSEAPAQNGSASVPSNAQRYARRDPFDSWYQLTAKDRANREKQGKESLVAPPARTGSELGVKDSSKKDHVTTAPGSAQSDKAVVSTSFGERSFRTFPPVSNRPTSDPRLPESFAHDAERSAAQRKPSSQLYGSTSATGPASSSTAPSTDRLSSSEAASKSGLSKEPASSSKDSTPRSFATLDHKVGSTSFFKDPEVIEQAERSAREREERLKNTRMPAVDWARLTRPPPPPLGSMWNRDLHTAGQAAASSSGAASSTAEANGVKDSEDRRKAALQYVPPWRTWKG